VANPYGSGLWVLKQSGIPHSGVYVSLTYIPLKSFGTGSKSGPKMQFFNLDSRLSTNGAPGSVCF
jgi:hypothetical protein